MSDNKNIKRVPRDLDTNFDFRFGDKLKKSGEIIVAHSTSSNLLPEILKYGLKRDSESVWENTSSGKLFFEVEPTRTHHGENVYGWKSVQKHGGVPVTLYVKVKQNKLRTDMDDADLGERYQKNQKECTCDVPAEDILGLNFVGSIDVAPKDFIEFYQMFNDEDDKMKNGGSFEKSVFIHSAEKEHRDSIIANGLHGSKNPVVINGIFTFPEQWGHHKSSFDKSQFDQYKIKLKDNAVIFWTDSNRPLDALMGSGTPEYNKVYNDILKNTSLKSKDEVMNVLMNLHGGNNEVWFKWKAEFSRGIEKYLNQNGYAGIQQGGEIVITDLNAIESITLNGKKIKVNSDKKDNKMENKKFVDGGNLDRALDNSNAKPEEIISNEINFDTRKGLNRSDKVVPKDVVEEIEEKGMSLERLESLGLPIFKYQTQITVHGVFEGIGSGRVGGYKNLLSNQNQTLGIKYNAIDLEKKKTIAKSLRLDREFNDIKDGFAARMDSRGFQIYKRRQAENKEQYAKVVEELKSDSEKIPSNFIGKKGLYAYKIWGTVIVELMIDFKAIKQENLWSFISSLTDGRISNEESFNVLLEKEKAKEKERHDTYEKERKEREEKERNLLNELKEKSTFSKSTELPLTNEFIVAVLGLSYSEAVIKVYSVFRNKTGRKVYSVKNVKDWSEVPTTISDETRNSRGNKFFDETTIKVLTKYIEKGMLFDINVPKKEEKKPQPTSIYTTDTKTETLPAGDVLLLDDPRYQLIQSKHTKTGDTIYLFKLKQRVDRDDYKKIESNVKAIRGYYSSFVTAFILKSAISANEAEMLLKGSALEHKKENGGEISDNPKINEAANNEVEKLVNETEITKEEAVKEMKEGVKVEEEHRETLEKLNKGEITVEEALAETASVHIEEKKDYYTGGLNPMENKDKSNDELKKQLSETELALFNKAEERLPNVNLARTIELAENIARLENKERKSDLAFFAEALQYTTSDVENDVYARFWADDMLYMVNRSNSGFVGLQRAIEVGAIENGEEFLEHIKAFKQAAETFRDLTNKGQQALIVNFVESVMLGNSELSTQQDYIWGAINDLYKLIYYAKQNETDTSKIVEYIGELTDKYNSETELEKLKNESNQSNQEEKNEEGSIEYTEGDFENGTKGYGANIRYKELLAVIPLGRYETKEEVERRAEKILEEFKAGVLGEELQELSNLEAQAEWKEFEKTQMQYPIVIEWSEGTKEKNIGFDYLHQLDKKIKSFGVTSDPTHTYIKTKVWFRDYPYDGKTDYVTIYNGHSTSDFNPETEEVIDFLKKHYPNFDWDVYEYGDKYKFGHLPEPEYKAGDLVRVTIEDDSEERPNYRYEYGYVTDKKPTYVRRSEKWKPHYIYDIVDMFDSEKVFTDVMEWRMNLRTEDEVKEELTSEKLRLGHADLLIKEEADLLADKYVSEINKLHEEYSKNKGNKYLKENYEEQIYTQFYDLFSYVVSRYPLMLSQWLNMQVEKLPNYEKHLLLGFVDVDFALTNLTQFFNSLNKVNVGKTKPKGIYELIPENFIDDKKIKQIDFEVEPSSEGLLSVMKPFFMKDDLRPNMASINFDKHGATSTDAHRLMFLKGKSDKIGIYGYGKIASESGQYVKRGKYLIGNKNMKYPKYEAVIPKKYSDVISIDRDTVQKIVNSLRTFKNVNYYGKHTDRCHVSFYKGEVTAYNITFLIELFEAWLKVGFDKLEMTNKTESLYKNMPRRTVLIVSPDIAKFTNGLKASGSVLMAIIADDSGNPNIDIERGEMYLDMNTGIAETAGVTDDLFTDFNSSFGTYGAETESKEIEEMQMMIDLMEDTVKENPTEENVNYLELLKETLIDLRKKNEDKFKCGGKMYYFKGGKVNNIMYKNGGLFDDNELNNLEQINKINNSLFYRYYPVGVNPFEVSFEPTNKYGYGIYFLDNPYYYKNKFTDGRLITIKPKLKNPMIFTEKSNRTPNGEYAEALLAAMKNDNIADRDAFTRKMVEAGYDSLIAFEPRGTYLVLFSNDPDLYDVDSDLSPSVIDERIKNELSEKLEMAVTSSLNNFKDLNKTEADFMYNMFNKTIENNKQKEQPVWITSDGFKGSMKKVLLKKNYIDDFWSVFNKPMSYDRNEYALTEKGVNFITQVQSGLFKNVNMSEGGSISEIDNPRALGTALKRVFKNEYKVDIDTRYIKTVRGLDASWYEISTFNSGHVIPNEVRKQIVEMTYGKPLSELNVSNHEDISYGNVRSQSVSALGKHWKEWLKTKKFDDGGEIPENLTDEDVLKLAETAKSEINEALSKLYAERDFHGMAINFGDKSEETKFKFDDVSNRILFIQEKEKSIDEIISNYKKSKGGSVGDLEKELRKLQRDLNSKRLLTYTEGDTSEEEMARKKEREVKLARFNEVLKLLNERDGKKEEMGKGGNFSSLSDLKKAEIRMMDWSEMEVHFEPRGDNGLEGYDRNRTYYYKAYDTDSGTGTNKTRYLITNGYNPESGKVFGEISDVSSTVFNKYFTKI